MDMEGFETGGFDAIVEQSLDAVLRGCAASLIAREKGDVCERHSGDEGGAQSFCDAVGDGCDASPVLAFAGHELDELDEHFADGFEIDLLFHLVIPPAE